MKKKKGGAAPKNKHIYIVLTKPETVVSKIISLFSGMSYSHASISYCDDLEKMYSFGRRKIANPLNGGFVEESCNQGFFKVFSDTKCCVYQISVTEEKYLRCVNAIEVFKSDPRRYKYNHLGLLTIPLRIPFVPVDHFVCSHFVAYVLGMCDIIDFTKNIAFVTPADLSHIQGATQIYAGKLQVFKKVERLPRKSR